MKPVCLRLGFVNKKSALAVALARKTRFGGRMWPPKTVPPKILEKWKLKKKKKKRSRLASVTRCFPLLPLVTRHIARSPAGWLAGWLSRSIDRLRPSPRSTRNHMISGLCWLAVTANPEIPARKKKKN